MLRFPNSLLVFSFVPLVMRKVQKMESVNIQTDCETRSKIRTVCLHAVESRLLIHRMEIANTQNDYETTSK